jgi:hypothetical protein
MVGVSKRAWFVSVAANHGTLHLKAEATARLP